MNKVYAGDDSAASGADSKVEGPVEMTAETTATSTTEGAAIPKGYAALGSFMPFILIFLAFYFIILRPQQKRMKEHQNMINNLKEGDKVVVCGGVCGAIVDPREKDDGTVSVSVSDGVVLRVLKRSITSVI